MSGTLSADEVRAKNIAAMGKELGEVFTLLSNELTFLSWKFQELSELYGGTDERLHVMNRAAPFFFWLLQRTWWEEVLLGITRLVAPKRSMGNANLTFQQLPELVDDAALAARAQILVKGVVARADFAKEWRNKRIAHLDLAHALKSAPQPLPPATHKDAAGVLHDLAEILNAIESHYSKSTTLYQSSPITHGVMSLLYVVREGLRREDIRQKHLEEGDIRPEDWDDNAPAL